MKESAGRKTARFPQAASGCELHLARARRAPMCVPAQLCAKGPAVCAPASALCAERARSLASCRKPRTPLCASIVSRVYLRAGASSAGLFSSPRRQSGASRLRTLAPTRPPLIKPASSGQHAPGRAPQSKCTRRHPRVRCYKGRHVAAMRRANRIIRAGRQGT